MKVQNSAWGLDAYGAIPAHVMIAAQHQGGLVLGAYQGKKMVGILFGFTSLEGRRPYHYSHITGVARDYQSRGVGFKLKLAQRRYVLQRRQNLVKWTYDPLQAGNAYFNIGKLGTICRIYRRNFYGSLDDSLNRGRVTDRFEVEWWLNSKRVRDRIRGRPEPPAIAHLLGKGGQLANETVKTRSGWRLPIRTRLRLKSRRILVEIPESIVSVKDSSLKIARDWTMNLRMVFEHYFRRGYATTDVLVENPEAGRRVFYLLEPYSQP